MRRVASAVASYAHGAYLASSCTRTNTAGRRLSDLRLVGTTGVARLWAGMELRHLLALQAIAEHGSFHRAAAQLDYTQSGVSQQVRALERIVGEQLVERPGGSRPVSLTAYGEVVLRHARAVFDQVTAAKADVVALRAGRGGLLRVGAFQSVGATLLPPLLSRLARDMPSLRIALTQTTSDPELFELLEAGALDVTFAMLPIPDGPFATLELFADPFVAMVAADSALARRGGPLRLRELTELPLVVSQSCRGTSRMEMLLAERGIELNVAHRLDDNGTTYGLVAAGAGVALVPQLVAAGANGDVAVLELDEPLPPRRLVAAWHKDRSLPAARHTFVQEVLETCRGLGLSPRR